MNKINKEEMFENLKGFLKSKGIELQEGTYTQRIQNGCGILTDTINLSRDAVEQAKTAVDKGLDQLRQAVHERTAPRTGPAGRAETRKTKRAGSQRRKRAGAKAERWSGRRPKQKL